MRNKIDYVFVSPSSVTVREADVTTLLHLKHGTSVSDHRMLWASIES